MKRLLTFLFLLIAAAQLSAQTPVADRRPLWVGLDMGGTWQTSDMKPLGGIGWSFTLSRYSRLSKPGPLYFGWRFRFMDGRNYGLTYHPLTSAQLNAESYLTQAPLNYNAAPNNGVAFADYKFHFDEFSYELIVGSNGLRRHGVLLYAFGGAGLNYWTTKTDQLDISNSMYNYTSWNMYGNMGEIMDQRGLYRDHEYETRLKSQWSFMPSAGIGMGYQWGNGCAIGIEHRSTWALNDYIDGMSHDATGAKTPTNDMYHYDGFFVRWTFGGNSSSSTTRNTPPPPPNPNTYTQQQNPTPTNTTVVTNPTPSNPNPTQTYPSNPNPSNPYPNNPYPNNPQPAVYPPNVRFTTPATEPYTTTVPTQQLVVRVENVMYSSQIQLLINSQVSTNFSFNPNTNTMVFTHTLNPGTNVYQVTASNQAGSASDVQTIIFKEGGNTTTTTAPSMPPTVNITNPPTDPYTSATQTTTVNATVLNVATAANVQVRRNGNPVNNFTFDPNTHQVTFVANLQTGANLYEVIGTNTYGSASDAVTINYNPAPVIQPPVVTITAPASCPYQVKTNTTTITANITNVTAANQVTVTFNNQAVTNFSFVSHQGVAAISFPVTLNPGANPFTITGTNTAGTDSKSCVIQYKVSTPATPPVVTITTPPTSPYPTTQHSMQLYATVLNVAGANEITVNFNSQQVTNFTYDMNTHVLGYNATFVNGNNVFTVTATNSAGTDSKSATIVYTQAQALAPPTVQFTTPSTNPYLTNNTMENLVATVMNVTQQSQITVKDGNNTDVPFTFNATTHQVNLSVHLIKGLNTYVITATNTAGSANDNQVLKLVEPSPSDQGRPGGAQGGNSTPNSTTINNSTQNSSSPAVDQGRPGGAHVETPTPPHSTTPITITLNNPSSENSTSASTSTMVLMNVTGAGSASEITVKVNGVPLATSSLIFNSTNGVLKFPVTLVSGANTILVSIQNSNGSASRSININCTATGRTSSGNSSGNTSGNSNPAQGRGGSSTTTAPKTETKPRESSSSSSTTTTTQPTTSPTQGRGNTTTPQQPSRPR